MFFNFGKVLWRAALFIFALTAFRLHTVEDPRLGFCPPPPSPLLLECIVSS
jgi:hypothetical protein